ncbi:metallophosphoesterase [Glaciecola sp. MH2013]|uniref:metallophosphoesterase n=1 Tax=Glaciecola sp. MH2013 TaxID=2785524 RepID=UPI001E55E466|nr:metallophosphoesterase [Glaciecola sp. MH2013]
MSDGKYLGYSANTHEWLFLEYQNIPVTHDGPYVFKIEGNRVANYISGDKISPAKLSRIKVKDRVSVTVDNELNTTFDVKFKDSYPRSDLDIPIPSRYLAISDMEGNFDAMVRLLKANGVINDDLDWTYGSSHLVLVGDMVDRGLNVVPLLWLIYKLETEAKLAGGDVHYILGNHERYLLDGRVKSAAKKYYGTFRTTGMSPKELWSEDSELGAWLRSKPVMLKIGDTLFVHGGVSPRALSYNLSLGDIDAETQRNFVIGDTVRRNIDESIIHGSDGLLFYRGFAKSMDKHGLGDKASSEHVDNVLSSFSVNRVVIGHTLVSHIGYDYDGKVFRIDVPHSNGSSEALLMENASFWVVDNEGNRSPLNELATLSTKSPID